MTVHSFAFYFGRVIPNFVVTVVPPSHRLKSTHCVWDQNVQRAVNTLNTALASAPVLSHFVVANLTLLLTGTTVTG